VIAVVVGCIVRARNRRKLHRLNTFLSDVKNTGTGSASVLGDWMNRRKGFRRIDQDSDGENEPLDRGVGSPGDDSNNNSGDETVTVESKQPPPAPMNNNSIAFKMGASL